MIQSEQVNIYTIQLLSKKVVANASTEDPAIAQALAETLSEQIAYTPVIVTSPSGEKLVYLDGCICPDYSEATDKCFGGEE